MVEEGCEMLGNFCLLIAMALYARQWVTALETEHRAEVYSFAIRDEEPSEDAAGQRSGRYDAFPATAERALIKSVPHVM